MASPGYHVHIRARKGLVQIQWRTLWEYRDLLYLLVRRDFVSKYAQTILGPAWFVIQPLITTLVFTVVFGTVAGMPTDGVPPFLFYLCGQIVWGYFAQNFGGISGTFLNNAGIFGKVYFPRLVMPLSTAISNLMGVLIQAAVFAVFWIYYKSFVPSGAAIHLTWVVWLLPLIVLQTAVVSLGVGLWLSSLTVKYRDFSHLAGFLVQIWMYATPVIYPLSRVPQKWKWVAVLNPMTVPAESLRIATLGAGEITLQEVFVSVAVAAVLLFSGLLLFEKVERTFIDTI